MQTQQFPDRPFTLALASGFGVERHQVHGAVAAGTVRRVLRGVFVRADVPDTIELRAAAAALVVAPTSVLTDRTAAWIHGIDCLTHAEHEVLPPIETCVLRRHSRSRRDGVDGRTRDLSAADVTLVHGVRVTTPARTALDLGCHLVRPDALAALDQFLRLRVVTREDLASGALRYSRRRGVVQLPRLIPLADPRAESVRESWTRLAILDAGLPAPEPQYWIEVEGVPTYRLDLAYPKHRVAVEYDGVDFHHSPEQQQRDRARRVWLEENGWTVIVIRRGDFSGVHLERWLAEVRRALRPAYSNRRW